MKRETTAFKLVAYKEQQTLVFADGSAAAQEAQEEEHASHAQDDVDTSEQQRVCRHDFPESRGVYQHPHPDSKEEGAPQLEEQEAGRHKGWGRERKPVKLAAFQRLMAARRIERHHLQDAP